MPAKDKGSPPQFEEELSRYLGADVSIADYTVLGEAEARRRKRETKKR